MKKLFKILVLLVVVGIGFGSGCTETSTDPNSLGGSTDLDISKAGNEIYTYLSLDGTLIQMEDSIFIASNNNGVVTTRGRITVTKAELRRLDTIFGTTGLPWNLKYAALSVLGNTTVDTTKPDDVTIRFELKSKITSEGIQDFRYSGGNESKPFMLVRYSDPVGKKYTFTDSSGVTHEREIVLKAETEDWAMGWLNVKSIRIDEKVTGNPFYDKITYITNHKFGFIGVLLTTKNGKSFRLSSVP